MSLISKKSPSWSATAFHRGQTCSLRSEDLAGRWHVLYWYPLNFTFICPTEIRGFESLSGEFEDEGVRLIGVSTDSVYAHKVWFSDRVTFPEEITHPIIADTNHRMSESFDVMNEAEGVPHRATVIIDPHRTVRGFSIYDTAVGRSPRETLCTIQALMAGGLCGADWKKGDGFLRS